MHDLHRRGCAAQNTVLTLADAVAAVSAITADEREVVAVVRHMLQHRSIRFVGGELLPTPMRGPDSAMPE